VAVIVQQESTTRNKEQLALTTSTKAYTTLSTEEGFGFIIKHEKYREH
jgi:hypothetical protein